MTPSLDSILDRHQRKGTRLVQILHEVQEALGWLAPDTLSAIAHGIGWPRAQVESTASFYSFFYTQPPGAYRILWSDNITDRMLGNQALMASLCQQLRVMPGRVARDGWVSVDATSCTGLCDQGPAVLVNGRPITRMTAERVAQMADLVRQRVPLEAWPADWFAIEHHIHRADLLLRHRDTPASGLAAALARGATPTLAEIEHAHLRGRGGAGFPTANKWRACREAQGKAHYVVCNADEGEPGTFKDRVLLSTCFDWVIDGMAVAAWVVGARQGLLYLRGEYRYLLPQLEARLAQRRSEGTLGRNILGQGFDFDIEIHLGAGAYICGEESALIESLEGKPGKPRIRPPFPVTHGYLGQPTTVNNVETLALAALIALHGGAWFRQTGTATSTGSKVLSVSGDVARPGIYEYPFGVSIAQVLADAGADRAQAITSAGAAGSCLPASAFARRIAFEDVPTGGSLMVFGPQRDMFEVAHHFAQFFAHESCGFCTPCRVGTAVNVKLLDKLAQHRGSPYDLHEIDQMHRLMQGASHCGLGNTATLAIHDILHQFRPSFERRLLTPDYQPAFDLDAALSQARRLTGRDDAGAHFPSSTVE